MFGDRNDVNQSELRVLVNTCGETLNSCNNELVRVAASVLSRDGQIFTGVQVRSSNCSQCSVCAEAVALGIALAAGVNDLVACVAVVRSEGGPAIWSPCGSCRELLRDHRVAFVIVSDADGQLITRTPADLLPWP